VNTRSGQIRRHASEDPDEIRWVNTPNKSAVIFPSVMHSTNHTKFNSSLTSRIKLPSWYVPISRSLTVSIILSCAPAAKRSPILIMYGKERETHESISSWLSWLAALLVGAYARRRRRSCPKWRPYSKRDKQPWFTVNFFDIGHPCYDQLTPVKSRHPLTNIT